MTEHNQRPDEVAPQDSQVSGVEPEPSTAPEGTPNDVAGSNYEPTYTQPSYDAPGYDTADSATSDAAAETIAWDETASESQWQPVETPAPATEQSAGPGFDATAAPAGQPSADSYGQPSAAPYGQPSAPPYGQQSAPPYGQQSAAPYGQPSADPYGQPSAAPYGQPNAAPYGQPSAAPYAQPSPYGQPSADPYQGYGQPGAGAYGQPVGAAGYGQPVPYGQNPNWNAGPTASGQSTLSLNYWLSVFFSWIPALVFYLTEKDKNALMDEHLKENMNFALTRVIVGLVMVIPILGWIVGGIASLVLFVIAIMGAIGGPAAYSQGQPYRFPINIRMIK